MEPALAGASVLRGVPGLSHEHPGGEVALPAPPGDERDQQGRQGRPGEAPGSDAPDRPGGEPAGPRRRGRRRRVCQRRGWEGGHLPLRRTSRCAGRARRRRPPRPDRRPLRLERRLGRRPPRPGAAQPARPGVHPAVREEALGDVRRGVRAPVPARGAVETPVDAGPDARPREDVLAGAPPEPGEVPRPRLLPPLRLPVALGLVPDAPDVPPVPLVVVGTGGAVGKVRRYPRRPAPVDVAPAVPGRFRGPLEPEGVQARVRRVRALDPVPGPRALAPVRRPLDGAAQSPQPEPWRRDERLAGVVGALGPAEGAPRVVPGLRPAGPRAEARPGLERGGRGRPARAAEAALPPVPPGPGGLPRVHERPALPAVGRGDGAVRVFLGPLLVVREGAVPAEPDPDVLAVARVVAPLLRPLRVVELLPIPARGGVQDALVDPLGTGAMAVTRREGRPHGRPGGRSAVPHGPPRLGAVGPVGDEGALRVVRLVEPPPVAARVFRDATPLIVEGGPAPSHPDGRGGGA
mmetsp:Transcript_12409/g.29303  ORF Transcript_12409/g.29303 Transcript_12409/m.29303 type:complete len:520 (-) Transcript_12409:305-1864(-)